MINFLTSNSDYLWSIQGYPEEEINVLIFYCCQLYQKTGKIIKYSGLSYKEKKTKPDELPANYADLPAHRQTPTQRHDADYRQLSLNKLILQTVYEHG